MSSADEDEEGRPVELKKKRKLQRACDICKRKKIGCDGSRMPDKRCSNCIAGSFDCTYVAAAKKRMPSRAYVEGLESRLVKMEEVLQRFISDAELAREMGNDAEQGSLMLDTSATAGSSSLTNEKPSPGVISMSTQSPSSSLIGRSHTHVEDGLYNIDENFKNLNVGNVKGRFFGPSSSYMLLQTALDFKNAYAGKETPELRGLATQVQSWDTHPWERRAMERPESSYRFPEDDLRIALVDLYFKNYNPYLQFLHRPTFERSIEQGLHLSHKMFGATVLTVCAIGSRFSNDPRVFLEGLEGREKLRSSGWKWFEQVQVVSRSLLDPTSLYELQFYCLAIIFLQGSSVPLSCWTLVGIGIRMAQDTGAHRRRPPGSRPTVESELWKRAFWILICIDTSMSAMLGRPCCMNDEHFDLDLPIACDDEYWEHPDPEQAFKQPAGKPSLVAFLNTYISLNVILGTALRTIYSIKRSKLVGHEQKIVADLDSALNQWMDSVPEHLRWDPNRENVIFLNQSAALYSSYYYLQILIHRPFISSPRKPSVLSFPSLAICTNAARSCCHVMDTQRRHGLLVLPYVQVAVFTSGVLLLLHVWGGQRAGLASDKSKGIEDVNKCIQVLKDQEDRWHSGGRLCNLLYTLASAGNIFQDDAPQRNKRERDSDATTSTATPQSDRSFPHTPETRTATALWHGQSREASIPLTTSLMDGQVPQPCASRFPLPTNSDELGRLPVYSPFHFESYPELLPMNNNEWESALFGVGGGAPQDPNQSDHMPPTAQEDSPAGMDDLFYDQMASVFSGWGTVPELPYEQHSFPGSQYISSMDEGHTTMPVYTHDATPAVWDGWNSTYSTLRGGDAPQSDSH